MIRVHGPLLDRSGCKASLSQDTTRPGRKQSTGPGKATCMLLPKASGKRSPSRPRLGRLKTSNRPATGEGSVHSSCAAARALRVGRGRAPPEGTREGGLNSGSGASGQGERASSGSPSAGHRSGGAASRRREALTFLLHSFSHCCPRCHLTSPVCVLRDIVVFVSEVVRSHMFFHLL